MHSQTPQVRRGYGMAVMFLGFFGSWWLYLGARSLAAPTAVFVLIALAGGALFVTGLRKSRSVTAGGAQTDEAASARRSRAFRNINVVQWSAVAGLIVILNVIHRVEWITPGIMLIVGLHFFPLARLFRTREHSVLGAAFCALAVGYPLLCPRGPLDPTGPIAAGVILWTFALIWALRRA